MYIRMRRRTTGNKDTRVLTVPKREMRRRTRVARGYKCNIVDEEIRENGLRNTTPRNADGVTLYASGAREPPPPAVYYDIIIIITVHLKHNVPANKPYNVSDRS